MVCTSQQGVVNVHDLIGINPVTTEPPLNNQYFRLAHLPPLAAVGRYATAKAKLCLCGCCPAGALCRHHPAGRLHGAGIKFQGLGSRSTGSEPCCSAPQVRFAGTTPLAASMERKVLGPCVFGSGGQLAKPVLVITITDGEPTGEPHSKCARML